MPGTWFIGDPHFGHEKVARLRGFDSTAAHDRAACRRWERQVLPEDTVNVMGDISGDGRDGEEHALRILAELPGRKRLICGNHDSPAGVHAAPSPRIDLFRAVFEQINDYGRFRLNGRVILLSHYPYLASGDGPGRGEARFPEFRLPDTGRLLVHAHTHHTHPTTGSATGRELCVSWDAWRRMVNIGDIAQWVASLPNPE